MAPGEEVEGTGRRGVPSLLGDGGIGQEHIASDVTQAGCLFPQSCMFMGNPVFSLAFY